MYQKNSLRNKYFNLRKKKYYEIDSKFFSPVINLIKSNFKKRDLQLSLYFPSSFEVNYFRVVCFSII